jgi:transposase
VVKFSREQFTNEENMRMTRVTHAAAHLPVEEVKSRMQYDSRPWCRQRWLIIYNALVDPREAKYIAKDTGVSISTVHKVISLYNRLGVASVETAGKGGRRSEYMTFDEEVALLEPFFDRAKRGEITTTAQIKQEYENVVGHKVHKTTIYRLLKRHKWRKLVPRSSHPQANKEEQENFKEKFSEKVEEVIKTRAIDDKRPVLTMAQDEGCFGRISTPRRSWAPKGIRPLVPRQIVREYVYVYAAIAPKTGEMTSLILPYANTTMMSLFLQHVSRTFSNYFIIMQVDQAGWHESNDLAIPENIRLLSQPAYSPELNPVEHLWKELREKFLPNRAFASLDDVINALCNGLLHLESDLQYIHSMTYFPHFRMVS